MAILFHTQEIEFRLSQKRLLKNWIIDVILSHNSIPSHINIIFCSEQYLLNLNKEYLNHDYYTDVITFNFSEEKVISGDIFISISRVKENASMYDNSFFAELHRMIIHGILHLLGFDDTTRDNKSVMTKEENKWLAHLNFAK